MWLESLCAERVVSYDRVSGGSGSDVETGRRGFPWCVSAVLVCVEFELLLDFPRAPVPLPWAIELN